MLWIWWTRLGVPASDLPVSGGYEAISPTRKQRIYFDDAEIGRELERIEQGAVRAGWPVGQSLFVQAPYFVHPQRLYDPDMICYLDDFGLCQSLNKGRSGATLDDEECWFLDAVRIIQSEQGHIAAYRRKMKG